MSLIVGSPQALANSVTLKFDSTASTSAVHVQLKTGSFGYTSISGIPGPYYWHEVNPPVNSQFPNPTTTFCVELTQSISKGSQYTYDVNKVTTAGLSDVGLSSDQAAEILKLWGAHYDTAWDNKSFTGSTASTAFQLALWEIVYDGTNLDLSAGKFKDTSSKDAAAVAKAQAWLDSLSGLSNSVFDTNFSGYQLVWLSSPCDQDQLTMIKCPPPPVSSVPAPPGVLMGLIGFGGCLLGRNLRRQVVPAQV